MSKKNDLNVSKTPKVAVVMGSDSDFAVLKDCIKVLKQFGVEVSASVCSAHRTRIRLQSLQKCRRERI